MSNIKVLLEDTVIKLKPFIKDNTLLLNTNWGSDNSNNRALIREKIKFFLNNEKNIYNSVMNLATLPQSEDFHISISHCKMLGGFVLSNEKAPIGIDIEMSERVKLKTVQRISNHFDHLDFPSPAELWTAKESSFKVIKKYNPKTISQISITQWEKTNSSFNKFHWALPSLKLSGIGVSLKHKNFSMSLAKLELSNNSKLF